MKILEMEWMYLDLKSELSADRVFFAGKETGRATVRLMPRVSAKIKNKNDTPYSMTIIIHAFLNPAKRIH